MKKLSFLALVVLCASLPGCLSTSPSSGTIGVNPDSVTVAAGTTQLFQPILSGSLQTADIKWVVTGPGCSGGSCGTIDINGIYTAPKTAPANPNIQIEAIDIFDPSKMGIANVMIGPAATIAITQPAANPSTVASSGTLTFAAKVSNTSNTTVNWSVSGAGCSLAACGKFSLTQTPNSSTTTTYTAPNPLPGPPTVTVTATSVADPTQSATLTVNLTLLVAMSPKSTSVGELDTQQFTAQVTGLQASPAATFTWSLTSPNATCTAITNPCGTITPQPNNQALYQAPTTTAASPVTVTAAVSQMVTSGTLTGTDFGTVTITPTAGGANAQLFDHYAFIYRGYSIGGGGVVTPFVEAGSLIFDGNGTIVAGSVEDDNSGTAANHSQITGTYAFDAADNTRGTITILTGTSGLGLVTKMRFILVPNGPGVATTVFLTDFGGTNAGSGTMRQQDKSQFSNATFFGATTSPWAIEVRGNNSAPAAIGRFDVQNSGTTIANGELGRTFDSSAAFGNCSTGGSPSSTITFPAFSNFFTGTVSTVNSSGNTTLTLSNLSVKGAPAVSATFSAYIVSASKLFLVETDTTGFAFVGTAEQQMKSNFGNADFSGVYSQSLRSLNGSGTGNGAGNLDHTAMHPLGTNAAGTITIDFGEWGGNLDGDAADNGVLEGLDFEGTTPPGGYYSVQPNGLALVAACPGGFMPRYVMYLISPSRAYVWNIDSSTVDLSVAHAGDGVGEIDLQQPQLPTQITSMGTATYAVSFEGIEGNFAGNVHTASTAISASGVVQFDTPTAGQVTFILDISRGAQNTGSTPVTAIGSYTFDCNDINVDFDGCQTATAEDFNWNYAAITGIVFSGTPSFTPLIPNHFWFVSTNQLLFDYIDTQTNFLTATPMSNIGGLGVKNQ